MKEMYFTFEEIEKEAESYNGWDWGEVYEVLNIDPDPDYPEDVSKIDFEKLDNEVYERLRKELNSVRDRIVYPDLELTERDKKVILACRAYCWKAGRLDNPTGYRAPIWKGLSEVKSDWTFLGFFSDLFPSIWD